MADLVKTIVLDREVNVPVPRIPNPLTSFNAVENAPFIDLTWVDNDTVATHYDIEHSINNFSTIANSVTVSAAPLSGGFYQFAGLTLGITNYFRIKARNVTGSSAWATDTSS